MSYFRLSSSAEQLAPATDKRTNLLPGGSGFVKHIAENCNDSVSVPARRGYWSARLFSVVLDLQGRVAGAREKFIADQEQVSSAWLFHASTSVASLSTR